MGGNVVQDRGADRMPLSGIRIEQSFGRLPADGCGGLPAEIHGVAQPRPACWPVRAGPIRRPAARLLNIGWGGTV